MKYLIIREDDVSYFTKAERLKSLYEPLLERGVPFSVSVIPCVRADSSIPPQYRKGWEYEPFIPPDFRGKEGEYPVGMNHELIRFLKDAGVEINQHGLSHEYVSSKREFTLHDPQEIELRLNKGEEIILQSFGKKADFFVPPWDALSPVALRVLRENFIGLSTCRYPHDLLPWRLWPKFAVKKFTGRNYLFWGRFLIVEHQGVILSRLFPSGWIFLKLKQTLEDNDIIILVNHHWEYSLDGKGIDHLNCWHEILRYLLSREDVQFIDFHQLYKKLSGL